jgi:hypothetical protein
MKPLAIILLITAGSVSPKELWAQGRAITTGPDKPCVFEADEMEVVSSYLRQRTAYPQVIMTKTDSPHIDIDAINLKLAANGHGIPPDVRLEFSAKNKSSCVIQPFTGIANLRFISKHEEDLMFQVPSKGWSKFHRKYGKDAEMLWLSRIAFNSTKTLALLHVSGAVAGMAGGGTLYLFEHKDGQWVIKSQIQTWFT